MNIHQRRSGLRAALTQNLEATRQRNQRLVAALAQGYQAEHPEADPEHPSRVEIDTLAAAALGRLVERALAKDLAAGSPSSPPSEERSPRHDHCPPKPQADRPGW